MQYERSDELRGFTMGIQHHSSFDYQKWARYFFDDRFGDAPWSGCEKFDTFG